MISSFLITTLLLREQSSRGSVELGRFYLWRTLRIFPPYYAYLLVVGSLVGAGAYAEAGIRRLPAWSYTSNFVATGSWLTGHSWSLSVEEQFYLCWPIALALGGRRRCLRLALAVILLSPAIRVLLFLSTRSAWTASVWNFDFLSAGCCLALTWDRLQSSRWWRDPRTGPTIAGATAAVVVAHPFFEAQTGGRFAAELLLVQPVEVVTLTLAVAWTMTNGGGAVGRALNSGPLPWVGVGSYSIYLWQQLFLHPGSTLLHGWRRRRDLCRGGRQLSARRAAGAGDPTVVGAASRSTTRRACSPTARQRAERRVRKCPVLSHVTCRGAERAAGGREVDDAAADRRSPCTAHSDSPSASENAPRGVDSMAHGER